MAEERGDGLQAHAVVDRLGGQCVAELVRGDVADTGGGCSGADGEVDAPSGDGAASVGEHQAAVRERRVGVEPLLQKLFHSWVQRDVAVGVEFPDRGAQPTPIADLGDRVAAQADEFAFA